ncbi:MAG: serine hydrolase [Bacteroidota bacterium]
MKKNLLFCLLFLATFSSSAQTELYFPPTQMDSSNWETIDPSELGWCQQQIDSLQQYLEHNNTRAFLLLKDGKIVLEQYYENHTSFLSWPWNSTGKTLTAFMTGLAQQNGFLDLSDPTSTYLGPGWTIATRAEEEKITIRDQLAMTSGLDDSVPDDFCTLKTCLQYQTDAGSRWAHHQAPALLLDKVIEDARGWDFTIYYSIELILPIGANGTGFSFDQYGNVTINGSARDLSRFGLLMLNEGNWDGNQLLRDSEFFKQMITPSQDFNKSYGYHWWLNGQESYQLPQSETIFPGNIFPDAPEDAFAAMGEGGQFLNVVPSQNLVWIRMGSAPDDNPGTAQFNNDIWKRINALDCNLVSVEETEQHLKAISVFPNPSNDRIHLQSTKSLEGTFRLFNQLGQLVKEGQLQPIIDVSELSSGIYYLSVSDGHATNTWKVAKE